MGALSGTHSHIMGGGISAPRKSSETWSSEELASFLVSLDGGKYSSYAEVAQAEGLTGMALLQMTAAAVSAALNCSEEYAHTQVYPVKGADVSSLPVCRRVYHFAKADCPTQILIAQSTGMRTVS